ncbi:MAG: hypothetical protein HYV93_03195 [Candidatus Rokubacteria bacterium]|nr:hypothetical protein [Candidatus Rokubacteria bacterium]
MRLRWPSGRLGAEESTFAMLRGLTVIGGLAALLIVPLRPEHQLHLLPLLSGVVAYKLLLAALLFAWPPRARAIFLATAGVDLAVVFVLVWFTGGGESHFYLFFYLLVALDAYYFGPGVGMLAAGLSAALLAWANVLETPAIPWAYVVSRSALLGLLGLALGHVAAAERVARARAERLNEELQGVVRHLEAAREELLRAERLATVGRISAKLAHEVNNPISAISLNVDLLGDIVRECQGPPMGEAAELLRGIRTQIQGLAGLTKEYLTFTRLPRPRLEEESLNELVEELLGFVRPAALRQGVTVSGELDPLLPLFPFDHDLIRQALLNLVKNALEALPRGGRVTVATRLDGDWAAVSVSDAGPGVPEAIARRLFEPFFTTKPHGTGLGLAITRQFVEEHGGSLTWTNSPGGGASFAIRLPLKASHHE